MTIIEALVQLRNDLKLWVTNNLRTKVDKDEVDSLELITVADIDKICGAVKTVVLPETKFIFERYTSSYMQDSVHLTSSVIPEFRLELGSRYCVVIDGNVYYCVCLSLGEYHSIYIGDETFYFTNTWGDSGLPFSVCIFSQDDEPFSVNFAINSTEVVHKVAIYKIDS